jgi:hypothetical protein
MLTNVAHSMAGVCMPTGAESVEGPASPMPGRNIYARVKRCRVAQRGWCVHAHRC